MRDWRNNAFGRFTGGCTSTARYNVAEAQELASNHWSSTENSANNAWNLNFNNSNINNNNNKYNSNSVRPVEANPLYSFVESSVYAAYKDCLRKKSTSKLAVEYMSIAHEDLPKLAKELLTRTYEISTSTCFMVRFPKLREVFAAAFRDRIIHHWICLRLNPLFEEVHHKLGDVSHNCRAGFGSSYSVNEVASAMKIISCNYTKKAWVYKGDMDSFYMRISKTLLWQKIKVFIEDKYNGPDKDLLMWLTEKVIMHRPELNCVLNSPPEVWTRLKASKSLFRTEDDRGVPIGNLTTQIFANFFMSEMDAKAKELFNGLNYHYVRFVDDFVIICDNKEELLKRTKILELWVEDNLSVKVHKNKKYLQEVSKGVAYVGSYIKNNRIYLAKRTLARFKERIYGFNRVLHQDVVTYVDLLRIERVVNSYLGFCRYRRTYNFRKEFFLIFDETFDRYFYIRGAYQSIHIKDQYKLKIK